MSIVGINKIDTKLPKWVTWIQWDESMIFLKWNKIHAWCEASGGNIIILIKNNVNEIINLECDARTLECNKCWNKNVDSTSCLIYPQIKKTT